MAGTSIREVARRAGVSVGTVSNVLNRPSRVAESTRARVLAAIEELKFVRNESARHLRVGRSRTLGLVVPDTADPFFTDVARGVEEASSEAGLAVILCNSAHSAERERRALALLEEQRVGGVMITPLAVDRDRIARLRERGMGVVLLDRRCRRRDGCWVGVDHEAGAALGVRHLADLGHRHIAYVSGPLVSGPSRDRYRGVLRAVRAAGLPDDALDTVVMPGCTVACGQRAAERLMPLVPRPTAVFCANDLLAIGVLHRLLRAGLQVPAQMAVVGCDDIGLAASAAVPLTTVRQPWAELGRLAAELAIAEADGAADHRHRTVVLTPELIVRESSAC